MAAHLVLMSYHFPPAGGTSAAASVRLGKFVQYLPDFGWTPLVVSADQNAFSSLDETLVFAPDVVVTRVRDPVGRFRGRDRLSSWFPSPGILLPWAFRAAYATSTLAKRYSAKLILASSPPSASFVAGYLAHKCIGLPLVLDYRDQWTLSPYRSGPSFFRKWDQWLEMHILKSSSLVLVSNAGRLKEHDTFWGKISPRAIVIPNGYDTRDFADVQPDRAAGQSLQSEIVIRHLGAIYGPRAETARALLNALNQYLLSQVRAPKVKVQFIGTVPDDALTLNSTSSPRLSIEHQHGVLHKEALALELGADVLLLLIGRHAQAYAETSSKVFEYLATGRPILVGGESSLLRELTANESRVFWAGNTPSPDTFANFMAWLTEHGRGIPSDQACLRLRERYDSYDRRNIARQLASALNMV